MKLYLITINGDNIPRISNYGITYWYENDEFQSCLINVEHHNLNFNGSYDRLMYNQLIVSLQEEKFKTLGI